MRRWSVSELALCGVETVGWTLDGGGGGECESGWYNRRLGRGEESVEGSKMDGRMDKLAGCVGRWLTDDQSSVGYEGIRAPCLLGTIDGSP